MGKKKFLKWLIPLSFGAVMMGAGIFASPININADSYNLPIETPAYRLNAAASLFNPTFREFLEKKFDKSNSTIYTDIFMKSPLYAPTTTVDPDTKEETTTIPTYQIDLSGTGITDIKELAQFELPSNIKAINLAGNGITNEHLDEIVWLLSQTKGSTIEGTTNKVATDFASQIEKINLNDNNIDLSQTSASYLNNEKLIFGVQMLDNVHESGLVVKGEVNPQIYIREMDKNYLGFGFYNEFSTEEGKTLVPVSKYGSVVKVADLNLNDKYTFGVSANSGYFKGYSFSVEYTQFTISIDKDFKVERCDSLKLGISSKNELLENSPLKIDGFGNNSSIKVKQSEESTSKITKHKVNDDDEEYINSVDITIIKGEQRRTVYDIEFIVVDTIKPVIELIGTSYAYSSRNKDYKDPGCIAYDPSSVEDTTGEDRTSYVKTVNNVDVTTIGKYTIVYTVTDEAGNKTTAERIVEIKERVLDTIILRVNTEDISGGDDVILVVQPDSNTPMENYYDLKYYWFINDTQFITTLGDSAGKSTTTIIADDSKTQDIYVKLVAKQKSDGAEIILFSDHITLDVSPSIRNDNTLIIAIAIVVVTIIIIFAITSIVKYKKAKGKTHGKHKNFHKSKKPKGKKTAPVEEKKDKGPEIQVIRNYTGAGTGTSGGSTGGEGGGNSNFRLPETNNKDGMDK